MAGWCGSSSRSSAVQKSRERSRGSDLQLRASKLFAVRDRNSVAPLPRQYSHWHVHSCMANDQHVGFGKEPLPDNSPQPTFARNSSADASFNVVVASYAYPHSDVSWSTAQLSQLLLLGMTLCIPFAVAAGIKRWKDVETVVTIMGIVVAIGTLITAGGLIFGYGGTYVILGATRAYWGQPWDSSIELSALCLPFLFSGVLFGRRSLSRYWLVCGLFVLCLLGLVLTFSRETWLVGFVGLLLVSASWLRSRVNPAFGLILIIVVSAAIVLSGVIGLVSAFPTKCTDSRGSTTTQRLCSCLQHILCWEWERATINSLTEATKERRPEESPTTSC